MGISYQFSYSGGTSGTVTTPTGRVVVRIACYSAAGGTLTITPKGANQTSTAGDSITLPAGVPFSLRWRPEDAPMGGGTMLVFGSTDTYFVEYAKITSGA